MLGAPNTESASPDPRSLNLGFKRVWAVRVWTGGDGPTHYEVEGVVHRHPVTRPVTATMATRLVAAGVPVIIRERDAAEAAPC